jgi:undecaprenyl pyrophosphate phosphatase UppP
MSVDFLKILVLAMVQGAAELLPVSSSAHVIVAEKLMGLDPTTPAMTLPLVMLHTGTMFAVIVYFWNDWRQAYFSSRQAALQNGALLCYATTATGVVGLGLGVARRKAEEFSFALAVVLTPVVILKELYRLYRHASLGTTLSTTDVLHLLTPGLTGMLFSFGAGLLALRCCRAGWRAGAGTSSAPIAWWLRWSCCRSAERARPLGRNLPFRPFPVIAGHGVPRRSPAAGPVVRAMPGKGWMVRRAHPRTATVRVPAPA